MLFLIYIMTSMKPGSKILSFILFADDTNLFHSDKNLNCLLNTINKELNEITMWLWVDKISLNINKSHFILFKTRKNYDNLFFWYFNECLFCYVLHFFTHWPLWTRRKKKKKEKKRKLNIYTSQTRTQLHTDKTERKKHTPSTFFSIYMKNW